MNSHSRSSPKKLSPRKKIRKGNMIVLFFEDIINILRELNKITAGLLFTLSSSYIKDAINYLISIYKNKQRKKNIENDLKKLEKDYDIIYNKEFDDEETKKFELNFIADRHDKISKAYYDKFETNYPISIEHIKSRLRSRSNSSSPRPSSPGLPNFSDYLPESSPKGAFRSYTKDRGMDTTETIKPSIKIKSENQIRTEVIRDILKEIYNEQNILHDKFSGEELLRVLKRIEEDSIKNNFGKIKRKRSKTHKKSKRRSYKTHRRSRKS